MNARSLAMAAILAAVTACALLMPVPHGEVTPIERAASDLTLAWVAYDHAPDAAAKAVAKDQMVAVLMQAAGLPELSLDGVVPQPGIIVLVGQLVPDAPPEQLELYAKVLTALVRSASG